MFNAKCSAEEDGCVICMTFDEVVYNGTYQSSSLHNEPVKVEQCAVCVGDSFISLKFVYFPNIITVPT